jgi:hypothetical protein
MAFFWGTEEKHKNLRIIGVHVEICPECLQNANF